MSQAFYCPSFLEIGSGVLNKLPEEAGKYGKKVLVVMDPFFKNSSLQKRIASLLSDKETAFYFEVKPNPRDNDINNGTLLAKDCDLIIAVGGGSAIDTAKAINVVATNGGKAWDYVKRANYVPREITVKPLPLIAVPTTAGTGTEATRYSVITNSVTHAKGTIKTDDNFPVHAYVDAELMVSVPPVTTALTGIDAFAHCFEAYIGTKATTISEMFSMQGMELFAKYIRRAVKDGTDLEAREGMALCSSLGGLSISHSATTLPHGIGQALSGVTDAPHGGSIAVCMPEVVRWTMPEGKEKFAKTACLFDPSLSSKTVDEQAEALPSILEDLFLELIGRRLTMRDYGLTEETVKDVIAMAMNNYHGDVSRHPRVADEKDLDEIIRKCL